MSELARILSEQAFATKSLLKQIELRQSPSAYYDQLLAFLTSLCEATESEINSLRELSDDSPNTNMLAAFEEGLAVCSQVLREIHEYCECFEHAEQLDIPNVMMQLLNKLSNDVARRKPFILRGTLQFNYMYNPVGKYLCQLATSISERLHGIDENFAIFSFPFANSRFVLTNCALVHEFGHLLVDSLKLTQQLVERLSSDTMTR